MLRGRPRGPRGSRPARSLLAQRLQLPAAHPAGAVRVRQPDVRPGVEGEVAAMNGPEHTPEPLQDLIDDYLSGLLDEPRLRQLEERLRADPEARRHFVGYARLHTDLHLEVRARQAGARALDQLQLH